MSADGECRREFERWFREKYAPLDGLVPSAGEWNAWQAAGARNERDAARYRWLRSNEQQHLMTERCDMLWTNTMSDEQLDAAIDEALRAGGEAG